MHTEVLVINIMLQLRFAKTGLKNVDMTGWDGLSSDNDTVLAATASRLHGVAYQPHTSA